MGNCLDRFIDFMILTNTHEHAIMICYKDLNNMDSVIHSQKTGRVLLCSSFTVCCYSCEFYSDLMNMPEKNKQTVLLSEIVPGLKN
jgi:hypothetical protein